MSFFGFDSTRHDMAATGFSQPHDPFAGLSGQDNGGEALEFEDTYDGLGDNLDETDDAFNDDTFGGGTTTGKVGKDFDFFGQTAKVADAMEEEQVRFTRQLPVSSRVTLVTPAPAGMSSYEPSPQKPYKPARTGYEKYQEQPVKELQVDAALWGVVPKKTTPVASLHAPTAAPTRKMMSLEEVEAQMRAQSSMTMQASALSSIPQPPQPASQLQMNLDGGYMLSSEIEQQPSLQSQAPRPQETQQYGQGQTMTILQRPRPEATPPAQPAAHQLQLSGTIQPTQILQNPNRLSADGSARGTMLPQLTGPVKAPPSMVQPMIPTHPGHRQQQSFSRQTPVITHPAQHSQLSEEEKAAYLQQEARRAKRNHKIYLMSRDNGIMTPQDKNFITRIQLQQLVAATGNPNEHGTDESLVEDFYYQVLSQIQGGQRQHPSQPLNNFAQTYLYQTGNRHGGLRRHNRGPENHMQRMEQQVQRAVEAAKNKPKNKQLVIEGSLGKISFSNAKTPKPLLNIKRSDSANEAQRPSSANKASHAPSGRDGKNELRSIESIYTTLMRLEDHERMMPPQPTAETNSEAVQAFIAWREEAQRLNSQLWAALRVHDVPEDDNVMHPFIALLTYPKGRKAMPRVFRQSSVEQKTTVLTLIIVSLDGLDVIRHAQVDTDNTNLNAAMREDIDSFSSLVMSTLFGFMNELDLDIIAGILGIMCSRNVHLIAKSRIGASMLTMILSRAEIIKHLNGGNEQAWRSW